MNSVSRVACISAASVYSDRAPNEDNSNEDNLDRR